MGKPSSSQDPLLGQLVGGRYEVVRLIGRGGMGAIYEVRNIKLGRGFALKTLTGDAAGDADMLQRFRREADVIAGIKHPNIVDVIDWEELEDGSPAIVMELLQGEDLAARIRDSAPLPWPTIARIADQVLAGLAIAHANGVVHRDLKPQNVFLATDDSGDERVKLLDFGVSKIRDSKSLVTTDARLLGTPAYMSPEQAEGRADHIGSHTDVWAIGTILHEMATGQFAFTAPSLPAILYKICHAEPDPLRDHRADAPDAFVALLGEMLTRDIAHRLSDVTVARVRLREALRELPGVSYSEIMPAVRITPPAGTAAVRPSGNELTPGGRRKRYTDALTDTVHGTAAPAAPTRPPRPDNQIATANTITADVVTPSVATRRRWAPIALATGLLAVGTVVIAIVVASRGKDTVAAAPAPVEVKTVEPAIAVDAAVATAPPPVTPDAAAAAAPATPPAIVPVVAKPATRPKPTSAPPSKPAPATAPKQPDGAPAKPPEPAKKKPCAKDDLDCLYGDGT